MTSPIHSLPSEKIHEITQWARGELSFLPSPPEEMKKKADKQKFHKKKEDEWGQAILRILRPNKKSKKTEDAEEKENGNWTTIVGEEYIRYLYELKGHSVSKPTKQNGHEVDWETPIEMVEVKTQTYFTSGTASEKILGVPFKYADIPVLYKKPLKIVCLAGAEKRCREEYGNLGATCSSEQKKKMLDIWCREFNIEFVSATELL